MPSRRRLPSGIARLAEVICLGGSAVSLGAVLAGAIWSRGAWILGGVAGLFVFSVAPTWVVGSYDSVRAGQTASPGEVRHWSFGATWGLLGWASYVIAQRARKRQGRR
jgi:hypothetical protein